MNQKRDVPRDHRRRGETCQLSRDRISRGRRGAGSDRVESADHRFTVTVADTLDRSHGDEDDESGEVYESGEVDEDGQECQDGEVCEDDEACEGDEVSHEACERRSARVAGIESRAAGASDAAGAREDAGDRGDRAPGGHSGAGAEVTLCGVVVAGRKLPSGGTRETADDAPRRADHRDARHHSSRLGARLRDDASAHAVDHGSLDEIQPRDQDASRGRRHEQVRGRRATPVRAEAENGCGCGESAGGEVARA